MLITFPALIRACLVSQIRVKDHAINPIGNVFKHRQTYMQTRHTDAHIKIRVVKVRIEDPILDF